MSLSGGVMLPPTHVDPRDGCPHNPMVLPVAGGTPALSGTRSDGPQRQPSVKNIGRVLGAVKHPPINSAGTGCRRPPCNRNAEWLCAARGRIAALGPFG